MYYLDANKALISAVVEQDIDGVRHALDDGADINYQDYSEIGSSFGVTALSEASWLDSDDIFYLLLHHKDVVIDLPDENSSTPLHKVSAMGNIERAKMLIEEQANVNHLDNKGLNAIDTARECYQKEMVHLLENYKKNRVVLTGYRPSKPWPKPGF